MKEKTVRKTLIFSLLLMVLVIWIGSDTCLRRIVFFGMADVYDYKHLPVREISASEKVFTFVLGNSVNTFPVDSIKYGNRYLKDPETIISGRRTTAFLVIRNDTLIYEKYFNGHTRETPCKIFSITKNVISGLIGIAQSRGYITSIDDPVSRYIPELEGKDTGKITIQQCLNGTAGIRYDGSYFPWSDEAKMYYKPDIRSLLLKICLEAEPGTRFRTENYSAQLLGFVLERATGMSVSAFLEKVLWTRIGTEYPAMFVLDSEEHRFEKTESGLVVRPVDLAKFGRLMLHNGQWDGAEIIPASWVHASTTYTTADSLGLNWSSGTKKEYYKNMWWGFSENGSLDRYSANGHFFQRLYISPGKNVIVIRLGTDGSGVSWGRFISSLIHEL